jgi:hypothetical protein
VSRQVQVREMLARTSQRSACRWVYTCPRRCVAGIKQLAFDSAAPVQAIRMAGCGGRCEALEHAVHPLSAFAAGSMASDRLWFHCRIVASASLYRRPSDKCLPRAPILPYFPCSPSVTRFGAYPAPGGTARLCFALRAPLRVSAFKKSLCKERKKIFRTFRKRRRLALGAGHTRVASRKSVPRVIRANTNKEN